MALAIRCHWLRTITPPDGRRTVGLNSSYRASRLGPMSTSQLEACVNHLLGALRIARFRPGSRHFLSPRNQACSRPWTTGYRFLPEQFQPELHLTSRGGCAGDCSRRARKPCRRKHDETGRVEISPVQQVENLCAKLQRKTLMNGRVLDRGKIPGRQTGAIPSHAGMGREAARVRSNWERTIP